MLDHQVDTNTVQVFMSLRDRELRPRRWPQFLHGQIQRHRRRLAADQIIVTVNLSPPGRAALLGLGGLIAALAAVAPKSSFNLTLR